MRLRVDAQAAQRLVHLLAALHRDVEIAFAAKEDGWSVDSIGVQKRIGDFHVGVPRFLVHGGPISLIVLNDVLIGAIKGDGEGGARAAGGGFETGVGGDHVIGQDSAVAPAADAQTIRIGDAHGDDAVDAGFKILHFIDDPSRRRWPSDIWSRGRRCRDNSCAEQRSHGRRKTGLRS